MCEWANSIFELIAVRSYNNDYFITWLEPYICGFVYADVALANPKSNSKVCDRKGDSLNAIQYHERLAMVMIFRSKTQLVSMFESWILNYFGGKLGPSVK